MSTDQMPANDEQSRILGPTGAPLPRRVSLRKRWHAASVKAKTLLVATASAIGLIAGAFANLDSIIKFITRGAKDPGGPGVRVEIQDLDQINQLVDDPPAAAGKPVFCDAVRLRLLLAHRRRDATPIRVHSVSAHSQPLEAPVSGKCSVDPLSARPYGIVETETYVLTAEDARLSARYIESVENALPVQPQDLLRLPDNALAIELDEDEGPVAFEVILESRAVSPQEIWFSVVYDYNGEMTARTPSVYLWK